MKNVLIVDDEKSLLLSLQAGFEAYKDRFNVLTAQNGKEAVEIIETYGLDLLVTDLKMPVMDGLELLAYMSKNFSSVPFIVMTAFGTPEIEKKLKKLNMLEMIEKPLDFEELVQTITDYLEGNGREGTLSGISLPNFLQLIELEQKTCLLEIIADGKRQGTIYFRAGELVDAVFGNLKGEDAVYRMLALEEVQMRLGSLPNKNIGKRIKTGLMGLILNAMQRKDEAERSDDKKAPVVEQEAQAPSENKNQITQGDKKMALERFLEELKTVKGYKASAVMNFTGEILVSDSVDSNIDLAIVGATFNDIFRSAHEASQKIGLQACQETSIETPKGIIVMRCSGVDEKAHFHMIGILSTGGNQALMKLQMNKMIPTIMEELS